MLQRFSACSYALELSFFVYLSWLVFRKIEWNNFIKPGIFFNKSRLYFKKNLSIPPFKGSLNILQQLETYALLFKKTDEYRTNLNFNSNLLI